MPQAPLPGCEDINVVKGDGNDRTDRIDVNSGKSVKVSGDNGSEYIVGTRVNANIDAI